MLGLGLFAVEFGFASANRRRRDVAAPILGRATLAVEMSGRIVSLSVGDRGPRLLLDRLRIRHLPPRQTPERVQNSLRGSISGLHVGGWVWLRGMLFPPPPAAPDDIDFMREAYFECLGAVGFSFGTFTWKPGRVPQRRIRFPPGPCFGWIARAKSCARGCAWTQRAGRRICRRTDDR